MRLPSPQSRLRYDFNDSIILCMSNGDGARLRRLEKTVTVCTGDRPFAGHKLSTCSETLAHCEHGGGGGGDRGGHQWDTYRHSAITLRN